MTGHGVDPDVPTLAPGEDDPSSEYDTPTAPIGRSDPVEFAQTDFPRIGPGSEVPGYDIRGLLGEGGMGAVYLAEQHRPRRTVALKIIRPDRVSKAALSRFDYEAQILASLRHPGIAPVFEVGRFELDGVTVPYFAMEYIAGARSLTAYAQLKELGVEDRLRLFLDVCDAVRHGHQRGVIHRDLKPANIMVDNTGAVRIIDFGVARSAGPKNALATMRTSVGEIVGTLQYMSPEQCLAEEAADVRSDVYALGAVLYELLAEEHPYDVSTLGLAEAINVVTERPTPRLSEKSPALGGDLTVIVGKALEKDREDRYQTVSEFAGDIRRYLDDQPILARPVSPGVLLRKWVKRNRELSVTLAAAVAVLAVTSTVLVAQIVQAERRATANLDLAEKNLAASRESVDLVREMLDFQSPEGRDRMQRGMVDIEDLLDSAATSISQAPPALADTEAAFRELLGVGYISVRSEEKAVAQLERAVEIRRRQSSGPSEPLAQSLHELARARYYAGEFTDAVPLYSEALEIRRALHPGDHAETASSISHLAGTEQKRGNLERAAELHAEALEMRRRLYGTDHPEIAASLNNLGRVLLDRGDVDAAEPRLRESLEMITSLTGPASVEVSYAARNLANALMLQGKPDRALELYRRSFEIRTAKFKASDERVLLAWSDFLEAVLVQLERDGAVTDPLAIRKGLAGKGRDRVRASGTLADALGKVGRWKDAAVVLDGAIALARESADQAYIARVLIERAACAVELADFEGAEVMLAEAAPLARDESQQARHVETVGRLVASLKALGRSTDAARCARLAGR